MRKVVELCDMCIEKEGVSTLAVITCRVCGKALCGDCTYNVSVYLYAATVHTQIFLQIPLCYSCMDTCGKQEHALFKSLKESPSLPKITDIILGSVKSLDFSK